MAESPYSGFPVRRGELDEIAGIVRAKDLLVEAPTGYDPGLKECLHPALLVPESTPALRVLEEFRRSGEHMALVVDEYGGTAGLVTLQDVLEAIVGHIPSAGEPQDPRVVRRADGSWLLDGSVPSDELGELLGIGDLPTGDGYQTLAGFVLSELERIPDAGDHFVWGERRFEVVGIDGNRVEKVLVTHTDGPGPEGA